MTAPIMRSMWANILPIYANRVTELWRILPAWLLPDHRVVRTPASICSNYRPMATYQHLYIDTSTNQYKLESAIKNAAERTLRSFLSWEKPKNEWRTHNHVWIICWMTAPLRSLTIDWLWIDLKISRGAPQQRPLEKIGKSGSERLCGLMSSVIKPSFSSIGYEL